MNFDTIFNNAMNLIEGINPATKQQDVNYDDKGQPINPAKPPTGTPVTTPSAGNQPPAAATPQPSTTQQTNTQQPVQPAQPAAPQQATPQIKPVQLPANMINMKTQDFVNQLSQAAGPQGAQLIQSIIQNLNKPK